MNRDPQWAPTDCSTVCSLHFEVKDFYFTEGGLRRLSTEAVPTINTVVSTNNIIFINIPVSITKKKGTTN